MGGVPLTREEVKGFRHDWIYFMGFFSLLFFFIIKLWATIHKSYCNPIIILKKA